MTQLDDAPVAAADRLAGVYIIDCDAHLTEPPELWTSRAPEHLVDRMPLLRTVDGVTAWYLDGEVWASIGGNTLATSADGGAPEKVHGANSAQPYERIDLSSYQVKERLDLLDNLGIYAQVLYPNGIGFASNHIFAIEDTEIRSTVLRIYNDFLVGVQKQSNGRLFPQALLPVWDMDLCVSEINRLADQGITGFTLSDKPEMIGLPELWESYWDPMWQLFNDRGLVANFHIGSGARREELQALRTSRFRSKEKGQMQIGGSSLSLTWTEFGWQRRAAVFSTQFITSNLRIIVNLCMSNLFDRFPKLKIVSAESGIGWIPFLLESMDFQYDEMVVSEEEVNHAKKRPSEYFRDHIYVMFWFEKIAPERLIDCIGVKNVLVETDIPHPVCLYPNPKEHFLRVLGRHDDETIRRVLQDNAAELYGIPLPAKASTAQ
jgi:predicted TIM-barrel fold metal-dependent hydrolase